MSKDYFSRIGDEVERLILDRKMERE